MGDSSGESELSLRAAEGKILIMIQASGEQLRSSLSSAVGLKVGEAVAGNVHPK